MKNKKLKLYSSKIASTPSASPCRRYLTEQAMMDLNRWFGASYRLGNGGNSPWLRIGCDTQLVDLVNREGITIKYSGFYHIF